MDKIFGGVKVYEFIIMGINFVFLLVEKWYVKEY